MDDYMRVPSHMLETTTSGEKYIYCVHDSGQNTNSTAASPWMVREETSKQLTAKQKKMIKEEIKIWLNEDLKKSIKKEAKQLFKDVEKLKKAKRQLQEDLISFKIEWKETKKCMKDDIAEMKEALEDYATNILRFQNLDL